LKRDLAQEMDSARKAWNADRETSGEDQQNEYSSGKLNWSKFHLAKLSREDALKPKTNRTRTRLVAELKVC
jgi:hypothetical protein